jgi:hypothetical protein
MVSKAADKSRRVRQLGLSNLLKTHRFDDVVMDRFNWSAL